MPGACLGDTRPNAPQFRVFTQCGQPQLLQGGRCGGFGQRSRRWQRACGGAVQQAVDHRPHFPLVAPMADDSGVDPGGLHFRLQHILLPGPARRVLGFGNATQLGEQFPVSAVDLQGPMDIRPFGKEASWRPRSGPGDRSARDCSSTAARARAASSRKPSLPGQGRLWLNSTRSWRPRGPPAVAGAPA